MGPRAADLEGSRHARIPEHRPGHQRPPRPAPAPAGGSVDGRGQLKQLTGLSRPTVADLVERLTASGLIEVAGESGEQRRGAERQALRHRRRARPPRRPRRTHRGRRRAGLRSARPGAGRGVRADRRRHRHRSAVERAVSLVERAAKEAGADRLHTVGIGAPGLIDPASGELRDSTGLPEWHRRLMAALRRSSPRRGSAWENEDQPRRPGPSSATGPPGPGHVRPRIRLGLGIGAAVVLDGTLRRGVSGGAGEVGFMPVPGTSGLPSATDCDGCFHSVAGGGGGVRPGGAARRDGDARRTRAARRRAGTGGGQPVGNGSGPPPGPGRRAVPRRARRPGRPRRSRRRLRPGPRLSGAGR